MYKQILNNKLYIILTILCGIIILCTLLNYINITSFQCKINQAIYNKREKLDNIASLLTDTFIKNKLENESSNEIINVTKQVTKQATEQVTKQATEHDNQIIYINDHQALNIPYIKPVELISKHAYVKIPNKHNLLAME
jgi:Na+-transporting NADH:ubiquinone oxidoreductase subunit NqrC